MWYLEHRTNQVIYDVVQVKIDPKIDEAEVYVIEAGAKRCILLITPKTYILYTTPVPH